MNQHCKIEIGMFDIPAVEQILRPIESTDLFGRWNESRLLAWVAAQLAARDPEQMDEARIAA